MVTEHFVRTTFERKKHMRRPVAGQEDLNELWLFTLNACFTDYIEELVKNYTNDETYDVIDGQDDSFIIPGRLELSLDGRKAYIELSSDVLAAIYQILLIKNDAMENRFIEGENVDLREYK